MTRFLYLSDTHLGATGAGYQQQQRYPERLPDILDALASEVPAIGDVDFILHGGDLIDSTTDANISAAVEAFDLGVPVYLCLGNHDLTTPDALERWLALAPGFFPSGAPNYTIETDDCLIHVVPNQWCDVPYHWEQEQCPHLLATQHEWITHELSKGGQLPHIIQTHCPVFGLPGEQTGLPNPFHCPGESFRRELTAVAASTRNVGCVISGHNHLNMCVEHGGVAYISVSSLIETPFEFKLFETTARRIRMQTVALNPRLAFNGDYDCEKTFVQGRECDRHFEWGHRSD